MESLLRSHQTKRNRRITIGSVFAAALLLLVLAIFSPGVLGPANAIANSSYQTANKKYVYLSDMSYITANNWSYNGWSGHSIQKDKSPEGGTIQLKVGGEVKPFLKGMGLHARGQLTYNISELSSRYTRFIAKVGLDASRTTAGSIWFEIFYSDDGENWVSMQKTRTFTPANNEAVSIDLDITGHKYLRIYADPSGNNSSDHGVLGNAMLVTSDYQEPAYAEFSSLHPLEYYDNILSQHDASYNNANNHRLILEREFVRKFNYGLIQNFANLNEDARATLTWMVNSRHSDRILEEVIEVGNISNAAAFLNVVKDIYSKYSNELAGNNGQVYEKVMIAIAAASTSDPVLTPLRFGSSSVYDPVARFDIIKEYYDRGEFKRLTTNSLKGTMVDNDWFANYSIPLMRTVVHDGISDIDFKWLNGYTHDKVQFDFWVVPYISPNYNQARFYDEANRAKYTEKYLLDKYNVPYGANSGQHYWMVIEGGGICWNESRFGEAMLRVNGLPAVGAYQPAHEMFFSYYQDNAGKGFWTGRYGGWASSGTTWGGGCRIRYPLDWANEYFADQNISGSKGASSSGYLYLAQANLNDYPKYQESLYYNLAANSYTDNNQKLAAYFKAMEVNKLNLDTYDNIINLYKQMSVRNEGGTITSKVWRDLSLKVADAYTYYPVAMYDLLKVIRPYLEGVDRLEIDDLEKRALETATKAAAGDSNSPEGTRAHANWLLGRTQPDPISFSFDGDNAGKIIRHQNYQIAWGYSLDGGDTFTSNKDVTSISLTEAELASITAENDIIVRFQGLPDYRFRLDIQKGTMSPTLYANDLENRVIGIGTTYEWRDNENDD